MSVQGLDNLKKAILDYDGEAAASCARKAIEQKIDPIKALDVMRATIGQVGDGFGKEELWLPDLIGAADAMMSATPIIEEAIKRAGATRESLGTAVIGTVYGDIHTIGKTMVATLLTADGFVVNDLGNKGSNMSLKGFTRNLKPLDMLTEEQVEQIHRGTLDVLWKTGIRFEHGAALKILEKNGCKVDYESSRVHFPPALVEESLRKCPSAFGVKARDPKNDLMLGGNTTYFGPFPGMRTVDLNTWEPRTATRKEFYQGVTVEHGLETVSHILQYTPYFAFEGVPPAMAMPESLAAKIRNSTKFTSEGYSNDCEIFTIQMAQAVGTEMFVPCLSSPPLTYYYDAIEAALRGAEASFPIRVAGGAIHGGTAPATIAGATISTNAELIAPIVLLQLVKPGIRIVVSDFTFPQDMRTGSPAFGAIGVSLHTAVFNQMWRRYGVPTSNTAAIPASKQIDFQGGYEKAISALLFTLCGANVVQLHGAISSELTHHPVQAILDDDIVGMIGRFIQGIEVNDETLAIDLIEEVGPIPGYFLSKEHTRKWWKLEQFVPKAADRLTYPEWMKSGKKSCLDYAKERMEEILATHKPTPLTPSQEEDVEGILEEARKYYKERGLISEEDMATYRKSMKSPSYPYE